MQASQRVSTRVALIVASLALSPAAVFAQQAAPSVGDVVAERTIAALPDDATSPAPTAITPAVPGAHSVPALRHVPTALSRWRSTPLKLGLYGTFAALQGLDAVTTLQAIDRNQARELNPLMAGLTEHPAAFIATKGAIALSTIYLVHRLSKDHPKTAVWLAVALNAGYSTIVISNYRQLASR